MNIWQPAEKLMASNEVQDFVNGRGEISKQYLDLQSQQEKAMFLMEKFGAIWIDVLHKRNEVLNGKLRKAFE